MIAEAERGLAWRREFGRGGTEVGIARARDISGGRSLSPDTVRRMKSFFARHEIDKQAEGFRPGEDGYPSNGRIAWALWGGDPGQSWANRKVAEMDRDESRAKPDELSNGDYVEWNSSGGKARGRISRVVRNGIAESINGFEVTGLPADPAAEIVIYEESDEGWKASEIVVAHKFSTLTKIEPLPTGDRGMATTDLDRLDVRDEVRAVMDENGDEWIEGYGIVFDELSEDLGGFRERITRESVAPLIEAASEMRSYLNHDENQMLGTTANGTLRLMVDDRGVKYSAKPPKTQAGRDALELVRGGYIKGSSFRFKIPIKKTYFSKGVL